MKIGITFGDPTVKPAGMGQDFGAHIEIRFRKSKSEYSDETYGDKSKGEIVSTMVSERFFFEVVKNRSCATKGRKGSYEQTVDGEVLDDGILFKMAMKFLISGESGKGYEFGEYKFKTQKDILEALQGDSKFREGVRTAILARYVPGA